MRRTVHFLVGLLIIVGLLMGCATEAPTPAPSPESQYALHDPLVRFKIATTTSLYDTGLWYYLEPIFEKEANVEMDIIC